MEWTESQRAALLNYFHEKRMNDPKNFNCVKIVLIGDGGVGKRSIAHRLTWKEFVDDYVYDGTGEDDYRMTAYVQGYLIDLRFERLCYDLNEIAQEFVQNTIKTFDGCIYVYSVRSRSSFDRMQRMHHAILPCTPLSGPALFVAANKTDWQYDRVPLQDGEQFSDSINAKFIATSAKSGAGCSDDDASAMANHILLSKIQARMELADRAAREAAEEASKERNRRSVIYRVTQRLKEWKRKQHTKSLNSPSSSTAPYQKGI
ncbi:Fc.00g050060.m01.CDS01 [Cosmosporella sp. VM-42]